MSAYHRLTDHVYLVASGDLALSHYADCNVYLLVDAAGCALIDAGAGYRPDVVVDNVRAVIDDLSRLRLILVTHAHADHAGGVQAFKQAAPHVRVVASAPEAELMARGTDEATGLATAMASGIYPPDYVFKHTETDVVVEHRQVLQLGALTITALVTPGHTKASTCYLVQGAGPLTLFSGDEVSWGGLMRLMNLPGSDLKDYGEGVQRLANLGVEALFPSHGQWTLRNGQGHIDQLIASFRGHALPPTPARVPRILPKQPT